MPLLAMNLSDNLFMQIKELVEKGAYQNPESFLEIAAFNQLALERGATPDEVIARGHRKLVNDGAAIDRNGTEKHKREASDKRKEKTSKATPSPVQAPPGPTILTEGEIEQTWHRLVRAQLTGRNANPIRVPGNQNTNDHVFGQVNRLFPLKLACRWLANHSASKDAWPAFETISASLAEDAGVVGTVLEKLDGVSGRKRDDVLSTGLPRSGNTASKERFLGQFIARVTRAGLFPTTISQYELAKFEDGVIALTDRGVKFASLPNPIIDGDKSKATETLCEAESDYLIELILEQVPFEREDMRIILRALGEGKVTPSALAEEARKHLAKDESDDVFKTQVSGLIARLGDLRLVRRRWQGRFVTYEFGNKERVEAFLKMS
jgi:DNA-binding transcriptional ArsR family regulator